MSLADFWMLIGEHHMDQLSEHEQRGLADRRSLWFDYYRQQGGAAARIAWAPINPPVLKERDATVSARLFVAHGKPEKARIATLLSVRFCDYPMYLMRTCRSAPIDGVAISKILHTAKGTR